MIRPFRSCPLWVGSCHPYPRKHPHHPRCTRITLAAAGQILAPPRNMEATLSGTEDVALAYPTHSAVDPRSIRAKSSVCRCCTSMPSMMASKSFTARVPISRMGWLMVVKGGLR